MRDAEVLARHAVEEVARDRFARREADGVHEAVERVPALLERGEERVDLRIVGDVAGIDQFAAEFGREFDDALLERSPTYVNASSAPSRLQASAMP